MPVYKNLHFDKIYSDSRTFKVAQNDSYILSYPEFIRYFDSIDLKVTSHNLLIGANFIYGWMPRVLRLNLMDSDMTYYLGLINEVKSGYELKDQELLSVKTLMNNSLVGASKLLHFINPYKYAIWDSHILKYISGNKTSYGIDKVHYYNEYLKGLKEVINNPNFKILHEHIEDHLDYSISPFRAIELVMFQTSKNRI